MQALGKCAILRAPGISSLRAKPEQLEGEESARWQSGEGTKEVGWERGTSSSWWD